MDNRKTKPVENKLDVFAERQFTVKSLKRKSFHLQIGRPVKDDIRKRNSPWRCSISITGLRKKYKSFAYGEDSLQSLTLGLFNALQMLHILSKDAGVEIEWLGPDLPLVYDWWDLEDAMKLMKKHGKKHYTGKRPDK